MTSIQDTQERKRLIEDSKREKYWKRWGPYLSDRQWGTVREDYSESGNAWDYFPHDHARSRAYRWGEDGIMGISDNHQRLCFAIALWNGEDPILKERLFGLTNGQGNHGEDVKEYYFYLDNTPTHSYMKGLYKYPHSAFPYTELVQENAPMDAKSTLIRVDLNTGLARRILQGHQSVIPENIDLIIDGVAVQIQQPDGTFIRPHLGVNGLVLDAQNEWLYFGPMHGTSMYRAKSTDLSNPYLSDAELAERVERYSDKPICDGISIDQENNIYVGDLAANGVGVIKCDRSYQLLVTDEKLAWTDSFSFGPEGYLYCDCNQLHRSASLNGGEDRANASKFCKSPPARVIKFRNKT